LGTPIGTPANLVFVQVYGNTTGIEIGFFEWMTWGVPIVLVFLPIIWLWLTRKLDYKGDIDLPETGAWREDERRVLIVFFATALAWMFRTQPFGGWSQLLNVPTVNDTSIALLAAVSLFLIPNGKGSKLLDWEAASKIPWGILILLGSGFSIAGAFGESGLSAILGDALSGLTVLPILLMTAGLCLMVTFMTELTSNTATTALLMPVLAAGSVAAGIDPKLLMVPAAISASFAFMLPVATGPNAIIYGSGMLTVEEMAKEGFILNIIGAVVISTVMVTLLL